MCQADDADTTFSIGGVTRDSTGTDGGLWGAEVDTPPPLSGDPPSALLSPADQALARLNSLSSSELTDSSDLR